MCQQTYVQYVGTSISTAASTTTYPGSSSTRAHNTSKWLSLRRDRKDQDCLCGASLVHNLRLQQTNLPHSYGPRQSKNTAYSDNGRLNVEVKYTPYSSQKRKAPIRVSPPCRDFLLFLMWRTGRRRPYNRSRHTPGVTVFRPPRAPSQIHHRHLSSYN